ncbi:signal peptidase I [Actinokineospora auranticolor]|uniref:Signal peptidase I n=1 Tax=Actinokineospora auranticolor TaxID=155976 RepID=A0A2S6GBK5_9PSEU|nr:signal peptidase I [Actinokineospora auranticolor]PPK61462.1 signal peptidase I [Actinokineospora auranticolor]
MPRRTRRAPLVAAIALAAALALVVVAGVAAYALSYRIDGDSMSPTLTDGDQAVADPFAGDYSPARLDVVVLTPPGREAPVVKRVVGVPGDRVRSMDGRIQVQPAGTGPWFEVAQGGSAVWGRPPRQCCARDGTGGERTQEQVVPPGRYWVIGDNAAVSEDSRAFGWVPDERIQAPVWTLLWTFGSPRTVELRPLG